MINYDDFFYSFTFEELNNFVDIAKASKQLAIFPDGFNQDHFYQEDPNNRHSTHRAEIESAPDIETMNRHEAKGVFNKKMPQLKREMGQEVQPNLPKGWRQTMGCLSNTRDRETLGELKQAVNDFFGETCNCTGNFLYPPGGYRNWHTNRYDSIGWRMYLVNVDVAEGSYFRFMHPTTHEIVTHWDHPGTVNIFRVNFEPPFWHCVASSTAHRWSQGFLIPDHWREVIDTTSATATSPVLVTS